MKTSIVCLCGSTKFYETFRAVELKESLKGHIVLTVAHFEHTPHVNTRILTPYELDILKNLHFKKIDLADRVIILNVGGYVGRHTEREVAYAKNNGKTIEWLEPDAIPEEIQKWFRVSSQGCHQ